MIRVMAEYRIKEGTLEAVFAAIREFVAAVDEAEPETEYSAYQVDGSDRFVHLMAFVDKSTQERHQKAEYTSRFVEVLYPNCVEPPAFYSLEVIV